MATSDSGVLVLAATPIGDAADASARLAVELARADIVAAEDTRRLRRLLSALGVSLSGETVSYHEHNEASRTPELVARMLDGARLVLTTDAGMPSVSDPGYRLVVAAAAAGIRVTCVPGPSAVLMALAVSGLPVDRFCFEGFLPRKPGERARVLSGLGGETRTMVFFEAPHRLAATLAAMALALGADRAAVVCRELTKTYEQVRRGSLGELAEWAAPGVLGEITVVVAGAAGGATSGVTVADVIPDVLARVAAGERLKSVCAEVAGETGLRARDLYQAALTARP